MGGVVENPVSLSAAPSAACLEGGTFSGSKTVARSKIKEQGERTWHDAPDCEACV
jgi:hypothetical protein